MNFDSRSGQREPISLGGALNNMESAQLVRRLEEGELAYLFKHALVQDTAYLSLTRHDRKRLHHLVGEVLEQAEAGNAVELAPRLAAHFEQAGDSARALLYFERAAADAAARYSNPEALDFYARALDAAQELSSPARDALYRARAKVLERIGTFDAARADLEKALAIAQQRRDGFAEWQSWIDLGFAWLARDYARAGESFQRALDLARESGDPQRIARTLNRVGNWYLNNEDPVRASAYHREALSVFEESGDTPGIAETEDLLGITSLVGSDMFGARAHFSNALRLFQQLDDPRNIAQSLTSNFLFGASMQGETVVLPPSPMDIEQGLADILRATRQTGWRAGESYGLWVMAEGFAARGNYGRAFELVESALKVAREIDHRQWVVAATMVLGAVEAGILEFERSGTHLEEALVLARELGSLHWIRTISGLLASTYIAQNDLARAEQVLDAALPPGTPARTLGQRQSWAARAQLALARHEPDTALERLDLLMREASNVTPETVIPHLWTLRAQAFLQQDRPAQAQALVQAAVDAAHVTEQRPLEWRALRVLAQAYHLQGQDAPQAHARDAASQIVLQLAETLVDVGRRENFIALAQELLRGA